MTRKDELERGIRESNALIVQYEEKRRLSSEPKEQRRYFTEIQDLRNLIVQNQAEYERVCNTTTQQMEQDIREIAASMDMTLLGYQGTFHYKGQSSKF